MAAPAASVINGTKRCTACGVPKPLEEFRAHPTGLGGRRSKCRVCEAAVVREWQKANPDKVKSQKRRSWQRHKDRLNEMRRDPEYQAYANELRRDRRLRNPEAIRAVERQYRQNNREKVSEWHQAWYEAHGREWYRAWRDANPAKVRDHNARRRSAVHVAADSEVQAWIAVLLRDPCAYCGCHGSMEVDHIVPLSCGGQHDSGNLTAACATCNRRKYNKRLLQWRPQ
jgi:5-methylcytosine-specific restriction endonuclease McrA